MKRVNLGILILALILGLTLGFVLANQVNRLNQSDQLNLKISASNSSGNLTSTTDQDFPDKNLQARDESSLSINELQQAIAKADADQNNLALQRNLGLALFKYAMLEQKTELLVAAARLLERAERHSNSKDIELHQIAGDTFFILGRLDNSKNLLAARSAYQKVLEDEPKNADLLVNIGLTYFYEQPSNPQSAIEQYKLALKLQPAHEKALENLTNALLSSNQLDQANSALNKLQQLNPQNPAINDLQTQINQQILKAK